MSIGKILIVDDEETLCDLLSETLLNEGYEVAKAYNGQSAVDEIESHEFDAVILDLFLPKKSGIEVLKHIAGKKITTQVIMATGYSDMSTAVEALKLGAFDFLLKPFNINNLKMILVKAVEKSEQLKKESIALENKAQVVETKTEGNIQPSSEKEYLESILKGTKWNKSKAAEMLGIPLKSLFEKIKKYDLKQ